MKSYCQEQKSVFLLLTSHDHDIQARLEETKPALKVFGKIWQEHFSHDNTEDPL